MSGLIKEVYCWIKTFIIQAVLVVLCGTQIAVNVGTSSIDTMLQAIVSWPRFYWSLLGPGSKDQSLFDILYQGLGVPRSPKHKHGLCYEPNKYSMLRCPTKLQVPYKLPRLLDYFGIYTPSV